jgi:glutaredoxin 3
MPLLQESKTYKPFQYPWAVEKAISHEKVHWGEWEAKLQDDVAQWNNGKLTNVERNHITQILRLFTQSDVQVGTNYLESYIPKLEYQQMADKIEFMADIDVNTQSGLAKAVARSVINEGMSLFSAFVMLLNYQRYGKMRGMCEIVEWSIRDETMHCEGMTQLFRTFCEEHPRIVTDEFKSDIYQMVRDAVALEDKVIELAYEMGDLEGLSQKEVKKYIRYIADRRLIQLGLKGNYKVKENPLPWVDWVIAGDSHKNFFEGVVTDYNAAGMDGDDWGWQAA